MKAFVRILSAFLVAPLLWGADAVFPYGAAYFRKSNPPEQDWARDHQTAARIGMNTFRHWFMWSAIEVAPGKYDWRDYDRMMDLAAQNRIKVVIAEFVTAAPPDTTPAMAARSAAASACITVFGIGWRWKSASTGRRNRLPHLLRQTIDPAR